MRENAEPAVEPVAPTSDARKRKSAFRLTMRRFERGPTGWSIQIGRFRLAWVHSPGTDGAFSLCFHRLIPRDPEREREQLVELFGEEIVSKYMDKES